MPSKNSKQSKQQVQEPVEQVAQQTDVELASKKLRGKFSSGLRKDKATYDLVHSVVAHLAVAAGVDFETFWSQVTDRDEKHFLRHFRKQKRELDPFSDIKNAIPAYSFFTKEHNSKLKKQHPDKSFGDISKMVGELWGQLKDSQKEKYNTLATNDKKRYQDEVEKRRCELELTATETGDTHTDCHDDCHDTEHEHATTATETASASTTDEPVDASKSPKAKKPRKSKK